MKNKLQEIIVAVMYMFGTIMLIAMTIIGLYNIFGK